MDIRKIREKVKHGEYEISYHAEKERYAEDITLTDIETAISNGEILEDYPNDPRGLRAHRTFQIQRFVS